MCNIYTRRFFLGGKMKFLKGFKKKLKDFSFNKFVSVFTTLCFITSIMFSQTTYASMTAATIYLPLNETLNDISKTLIPFNLGRITDAYYSDNSKEIIINIQDLHSHEQTQKNISLILSLLDSKYGLDNIYVEGATGSLSTAWLSNIKDSSSKQKVLDILLKNGRLTGGELFSVESNKNNILKGLEDKKVYSANFERLNNLYNKQTEINNYISLLKTVFNDKSKQYFSKENEKLNKTVQDYKNGKITTDKYIKILLQKAQQAGVNLSKYKSIINFSKIVSKQNSFDSNKLSEEIKILLSELKKTLPFNEYKSLIKKSSKQELEIEFYVDLIKKAKELNLLDEKKFKHTKLFFEYLLLNQSFNTIDLSNEEELLIKEINNKFAKTANEKEIYFLKNYLEQISHYLTNKMAAKEYDSFVLNADKFKLLWAKYIDIDNIIDTTKYFDLVDDFYKYNVERNKIFIKNLTGKNTKSEFKDLRIKNANINHEEKVIEDIKNGKKVHVVITGGFHTYGFNKLLEKENISYMVITPNITEDTVKAENLYENIFNEQYKITNATFANRPISEIIALLNKGEIKEIRPVNNNIEIEYVSGEIISLNEIKDQKTNNTDLLTQKEAQLIADVVIDIQELKKAERENLRAQQAQKTIFSTDVLEQKIREGLNKITDKEIKNLLEQNIQKEITGNVLTNEGIKNKKWYKLLTKAGLISLRESLVAVFEQKDFNNVFLEEVLGKINDNEDSAREEFLQSHEYYGEKEDVTIQLNDALTSVIDAMNSVYEKVFGYFGIHSMAQLAAKIAGMIKHKEYNLNIYQLSKQAPLLTKGEKHTYHVKFKVYFRLNNMQIEYSTGDKFYTKAPTKAKAFNNAVKRAAEEILSRYGLDRNQLLYLTMSLIRRYLENRNFDINKNVIEVEEKTEETKLSQKTNKLFTMRNPKYGEYKFNIVIPGLNDSSDLSAFQTVYARSPRQAVFEAVYQVCMANEKGQLTGGIFENLKLSKQNINAIEQILSQKYPESKLSEIIKNVKPDNAPVLNDNVTVKQKRQLKDGEKYYHVVIPGFNDRPGLEPYQYVYVTDERKAIGQAVLEIIKAKEREEIRGGYYNYRTINRENRESIINSILSKFDTASVVTLIDTKKEPVYEQLTIDSLLAEKNEFEITASELIKPLATIAEKQYPGLVKQTEKDIVVMLKNKIFTAEEIKNLLYQLEQYLKGKIPDSIKNKKVSFGTAGARGEMGKDFDFDTVALIAQARANIIKNDKSLQKNFFLANDSRFLGKWFSIVEERIFSANQIQCYSVNNELGTLSTPSVSYFLKDLFVNENSQKYGLAKGVKMAGSENITASHNPGIYNGAKPNGADGAQLPGTETEKISKEITNIQNQLQQQKQAVLISNKENTILLDNVANVHVQYLIDLFADILGIDKNVLEDFKKNNSSKIHLVIDGNHSVLVPEMQALCSYYGFEYEILPGTQDRDTSFEGKKPEPNEDNMTKLKAKTVVKVNGKTVFGIASDPDGDRFCVFDSDGTFVNPNEIGLITLDGLLSKTIKQMETDLQNGTLNIDKIKKYQGVILKSHVTSSEIDLLSQYYSSLFMDIAFGQTNSSVSNQEKETFNTLYKEGKFVPFRVDNLPVGWKNIANRQKQIEANGERFIMGVESSGGLSLGVYDKDGALATMLPVLIAAINNKNFNSMLSDIHNKAGFKSSFKETSATLSNEEKQDFLDWVNNKSDYQTADENVKKLYRDSVEKILRNLMLQENIVVKDLVVWKNEGLKILLTDTDYNGNVSTKWIAFRASGTEPKIRIYAETAYDVKNTDKNTEDKIKEQLENFSKIGNQIVNGGYKGFTNPINYLEIQKYVRNNLSTVKDLILNSIKSLQRLTYSVLFKDNMEYTIVADANDLSKIKEAELLSKSGIKVNLVLMGDTYLIKETDSRLSTDEGELAFCLIDTPNKNLTVYGYDEKKSDGQTVNSSNIGEQAALIAVLRYINNGSQNSIKILDLSDDLNENIVTPDVEEIAKGMFSTIGVGKTVLNLFSDALKNKFKKTDNMFIKPSLVASNLSAEQIDSFGIENINRLAEQGITTIIISANDELLQNKAQTLKEILQSAHNKGLKVMFNYSFELEKISADSLVQWMSEFNEKFDRFKENGGIDGLQIDISNSGDLATALSFLVPLSSLAKIVNEQNVGSFLSVKMPDDISPVEYAQIFNINHMKLVVNYDSNFISKGISLLNTENMIINISADKNGAISISKLSNVFENNKVSMISFDLPILESVELSNDVTFGGMSITQFLTSIFETTPDGKNIRGINKGRSFVTNRDFVIDDDDINSLYSMYVNDKFDVKRINGILGTNFKEDVSVYELKGFVKGLLETAELKKINAIDISFDNKEYTNLLLQTLFDYRINEGISFNRNISEDIENVLITDNFREEFKPQINEIYNILNGNFENKVDTVVNILASLKDNPQLNVRERNMVLEGLLLFLLGYARLDVIEMGNITNEETIENIKAILRAA